MLSNTLIEELIAKLKVTLENPENFALNIRLKQTFIDLDDVIKEILISHIGQEDTSIKLVDAKRRKQQKKKKWRNDVFKTYEQFIENGMKKIKKSTSDDLIDYRKDVEDNQVTLVLEKKTTPEEFDSYLTKEIENKIKIIEGWAGEPKARLCEYIFFDKKRPFLQNNSLKEDLMILIYEFLLENNELVTIGEPTPQDETSYSILEINSNHESFFEKPNSLVDLRYFPPRNKQTVVTETVLKNTNDSQQVYLVSEQRRSKDKLLILHPSLISNERNKEALTEQNKSFFSLAPKDDKIFSCIMRFRDLNFIKRNKISFRENELLRLVYPDEVRFSKYHYDSVRSSIQKLNTIKFIRVKEDTEVIDYEQLFTDINNLEVSQYITEYKREEEGDEIRYTIYISHEVYNDFVSNQITRIYGDVVQTLTDPSWSIAFALQQERIAGHASLADPEDENKVVLSYNFFNNLYRFAPSKKKSLEKIKECLEEMKKANFLIKEYSYLINNFHITFLPLSNEEIQDLQFNDKQTSTEETKELTTSLL